MTASPTPSTRGSERPTMTFPPAATHAAASAGVAARAG